MMNKSKKYIAIAFVVVLIVVVIVSTVGILSLKNKPEILQGQAEATEIRISGKLPGRIDKFLVEEGQDVLKGDTLVVINSPEIVAKYDQVDAIKNAAVYENQKIEEGTRKQIVESAYQLWMKSKSDLELATTTYNRISSLYRDSVVTSQRKDETEAIYKAALAGERAAFQQYQMALDGARKQDRESSQSMVDAARSTVQEVAALLQDARLTAPESGQIAVIYPKRGELVGPGTPIMSLVVLEDAHVVLNVREDLMPHFRMKGKFKGDVPALARKGIEFEIILHQPAGQLFDLEIDQTGRQLRHEDVRDQSPADRAADGSPARNVGSGKPQRTVAARWTALREHFTGSSDASWTGWYPEGFTSGSASRCPCSASCL